MDYAIILTFDQLVEKELWQLAGELAGKTGNKAFVEAQIQPHLTLAEFSTDLLADVSQTMHRLSSQLLQPIQLKLASAGFFPDNMSVLYLAPIVDEQLLNLHRLVNNALEPLCREFPPLYREENWVPHCTLALDLTSDELLAASLALGQAYRPLTARAAGLSLYKCCPYQERAVFFLGGRQDERF